MIGVESLCGGFGRGFLLPASAHDGVRDERLVPLSKRTHEREGPGHNSLKA